mmetsp:Transcript_4241/g.5923  ORF Transcript_4241/g.5923 Transcript_4241/m.5923 type:complete len:105 (-) Transcript_4241:69-383(-)|eukprot:4047750-Amphidinium_carterae.1
MARAPIRSLLLLAGLVAFGWQSYSFVSGPAPRTAEASENFLAVAAAAGTASIGALPAFAEELPPDEIYNRKVLEAASYCLIFAAFLVGLVIFQARKLVENKWLN